MPIRVNSNIYSRAFNWNVLTIVCFCNIPMVPEIRYHIDQKNVGKLQRLGDDNWMAVYLTCFHLRLHLLAIKFRSCHLSSRCLFRLYPSFVYSWSIYKLYLRTWILLFRLFGQLWFLFTLDINDNKIIWQKYIKLWNYLAPRDLFLWYNDYFFHFC